MSRTVHGALVAVIVTVLCSGIGGLNIYQKDEVAVTDKFPYSNLELESLQFVKPLKAYGNDIEAIPEDDISAIVRTIEEKQNENDDFRKDTIYGGVDDVVKQRVIRQVTHQYSPLYPQLPSGPPYNPYQPQSNNNPPGQNPYQQQPGYNPYGQNPNQQQPSYNPFTQNPNQQQPAYNSAGQNTNQQPPGYNTYGQNSNQQQPGYNPYGQNPNQQQPSFNPFTQNPNQQQPSYNSSRPNTNQQPPSFNPYGQNPNQGQPTWNSNSYNSSRPGGNPNFNPNTGFFNPNQSPYSTSYNNTSPGNTYRPPNGQYPLQNYTFNSTPNPGSFRPPIAPGSTFTTPYTPYNPRPGQPPYSNYPPSSGNSYPVQQLNSTSLRPPYYNSSQYPSYNQYPYYNSSQYPSYNNSRPNLAPMPNFPGTRPGTYNGTFHNTPQASPYFPGPDGKFPSNSYNPSIPNYPPQNNNQGQNNFFYPQNNNSASYDPRRVPPQNFSYHY